MRGWLASLKPFLPATVLIVLVSALLVWSDDSQRQAADATTVPRVALVQHASQAAIDDGVKGILEGLAARGYEPGKTLHLQQFNAHGDLPTANDIARQVTDGSYDLVITASTASLQSVANANQAGRVRHVFGVVADAAGAGVGVGREPLDHPSHMAGYNVFVPVDKALDVARQMNPDLRRVGLVWHTAESNSAAYAKSAREACAAMGLELLEANAETSSSVGEAAAALLARRVDALLVTGDVVVLVGIDGLISAANKARVPVFTIIPPNTHKGAIFDLGADYVAVGREVGELAAEALQGRDLATVPVQTRVPPRFIVNEPALARFAPAWRLPVALRDKAELVSTDSGNAPR